MAGVIRSTFKAILPAIRQRLIDRQVLPSATILYAVRGHDLPAFQADKIIYLIAGDFMSVEDALDNQARFAKIANRTLHVVPRVRLQLDEADRDEQWLLQQQLGYLQLEDKIVNALEQFFPLDAAGNSLVREGMRVIAGDQPKKDRNETSWGEGSLTFAVSYLMDIEQID